jgi:hypothetical protein
MPHRSTITLSLLVHLLIASALPSRATAPRQVGEPTIPIDTLYDRMDDPPPSIDSPGIGAGHRVRTESLPGRPPPPASTAPVTLIAASASASAVVGTSLAAPGGISQADAWWPHPQEDPLARAWGLLDGDGNGSGGTRRRARPARLGGTKHWPCMLPYGVDFDHAVAQVVAYVSATGAAERVEAVDDPHHLIDVAKPCAMHEQYVAAVDEWGHPVAGKTEAFRVVFIRP